MKIMSRGAVIFTIGLIVGYGLLLALPLFVPLEEREGFGAPIALFILLWMFGGAIIAK